MGEASSVLSESEDDTPDVQAVKALAQNALGQQHEAVTKAEELAENYPESASVQICCGTVLAANEKTDEALKLLSKHQGNLEACVESSLI